MKKKEYEELKERYSLPEWEEMEKYFQISEVEFDKKKPLKSVVKAVEKKISNIRNEIELILFPTEDLFVLYELNAFKEFDSKVLTQLYKETNYLLRKLDLCNFVNDENLAVEFIKESLEFIKSNFDKIREIYERKMKVWKEEFKLQTRSNYYL